MPRSVLVLSVAAFFVALGFGVVVPILPLFARTFGVGASEVGLLVSAFAFMRLITSPFCGAVNARLGERLVIGIGMMLVAVTSVLVGLARSFAELLLWRSIGGIGSALFSVAAISLVLSAAPAHLRGRASGLYQGGFLLGGMAGPAIGGALAGLSYIAPFFFYTATLVVSSLIVWLFVRQPERSASTERPQPVPIREALGDVGYRAALVSAFGQGWMSFGVRNSLLPLLIVETLHSPAAWTGISFAIAAVVQTLVLVPVGRAVDLFGRRPVMIATGLVTGLSTVALPWSGTLMMAIVLMCVYGVGAAMQGTAPSALAGDVARGRGGTPIAVFSMTTDLGAIIGPLVAGWLADHVSIQAAFAAGALVLLAGSLYSLRIPRTQDLREEP